jgi:large subunit ribosomal protein L32e
MTEQGHQTTKRMLKLRRRVRQTKPEFVRSESWRYVRIKESWRRPRGLDHKMRLKYDGWPPSVGVGYRGPRATKGLHPSGYKEVLVYNADGLKGIDSETQAIRIAHAVGKRKKAKILTEAKKKGIVILNMKAVPKEEKSMGEKLNEEEIEKEKAESSRPEERAEKTRKRKQEKSQS